MEKVTRLILSHAGLELARSLPDQACQWRREWATGIFSNKGKPNV